MRVSWACYFELHPTCAREGLDVECQCRCGHPGALADWEDGQGEVPVEDVFLPGDNPKEATGE